VYITAVLDLPWSGFTRLVALTAQFEAAGRFTARNRNTDRAGLSFGIIQWAQKPGRLNGLLRSFDRAQPERFVQVFGDDDQSLADGLLEHTASPNGGVNAHGQTTSPAFDLVNDIWNDRFIRAGTDRVWQRTQVFEATSAFRSSCNAIRSAAPLIRSERGYAFLLDVANQHGNGGMRNICAKVTRPDQDEEELMAAVARESIRRVRAQFGEDSAAARSTEDRRTRFRESPLLSDQTFEEA
jgi:hypothetical protein